MNPPFPGKTAGLLCPVFALRHAQDFGIGDTLALRQAIDFCAGQHFTVLQTLPIHDTVGDHSPYNPVSSRALSPALLHLDPAEVPGLTPGLLQTLAPESWLAQLRDGPVKHRLVHKLKLQILLAAHQNFAQEADAAQLDAFRAFQQQNNGWLPAYTLFRLLAAEYDGNPHWEQWRPEHHSPATAENWLLTAPERERLTAMREGLAFIQWTAHRQWSAVRTHAESQGVLLMGELSFGVSKSSVDVWQHPQLFDLEWSMGTRPVMYFDTNKDSERWGQNWGLPPYRWENHRSTGHAWLRSRLQGEAQYFHLCRIDHLRGYFRAYMFPWQGGAQHARFATLSDEEAVQQAGGRRLRFVPGPDDDEITARMNDLQGRELIATMRDAAGGMYLFAEIMGRMPAYMRQTIEDLALPNLTFPLLEKDSSGNVQPPASFRPLSLVAYGNHDHASLAGFFRQLTEKAGADPEAAGKDLQNLLTFARWTKAPPEALDSDLLASLHQALFETPCLLAVLLVTDLLGTPQRFNLPGSYGDQTWCERLEAPLQQLLQHPVYGPRIAACRQLIQQTGRAPA